MSDPAFTLYRSALDILEMGVLFGLGLLALAGVWAATLTTVAAISALLDEPDP